MTEIEAIKKTLDRKDHEYEGLEKSLLEKKAETEAITAKANKALVSLTAEQQKISEGVDQDFLKKYQTVKKRREAMLWWNYTRLMQWMSHVHTASA